MNMCKLKCRDIDALVDSDVFTDFRMAAYF